MFLLASAWTTPLSWPCREPGRTRSCSEGTLDWNRYYLDLFLGFDAKCLKKMVSVSCPNEQDPEDSSPTSNGSTYKINKTMKIWDWPKEYHLTYPLTFELFLPGCRGSWEEAGSRGSAGWSASWLDAAPAAAGPDDGEAELAFSVFWRFDTWERGGKVNKWSLGQNRSAWIKQRPTRNVLGCLGYFLLTRSWTGCWSE